MPSIEETTEEKGLDWVQRRREIVRIRCNTINDGRGPSVEYVDSEIEKAYASEIIKGPD